MTKKEIVTRIYDEVKRAKAKFPHWPHGYPAETKRIEEAAIIAEEAGEVVKAALDLRPGDPHSRMTVPEDYIAEIIQTAAMCVRALEGK
jgi:hypothetical protein